MLSEMATDQVSVVKRSGCRIDHLLANVQKEQIFMEAGQFTIEPGDFIVRHSSKGFEETYEVLHPGYFESQEGMEAHYQLDVKLVGTPVSNQVPQIATYHIVGDHARINQGSIDNSINFSIMNAGALDHVQKLREAIADLEIEVSKKVEAIELLDAIKDQIRAGNSKPSVMKAVLASLPDVLKAMPSFVALLEIIGVKHL